MPCISSYIGTDAWPFSILGQYRYTRDLLSLESHHAFPNANTPPSLALIATPLNSEAWKIGLQDHPDAVFASYFLRGIDQGFRIGSNRSCTLRPARSNMSSAREHAAMISDYLKEQVEEAKVCGPFPENSSPCSLHFSPIGIIPKPHKPNQWRLIIDMSSPEGVSINDSIASAQATLSYIGMEDVAREILSLGKGTLLAKIDVKSAYRIVPVHPDDRPLLGMKFHGQEYADATLPFGLCSALKIFTALADALLWILKHYGVSNLMHYLHDFITFGPPGSQQCEINRQIIFSLCEILGVPLSLDKCEGPTTLMVFLGLLLDTINLTVAEKLDRLMKLVSDWLVRKACTKSELESLIGQLQHAATVVRAGRSFLRRMIVLLKSRRSSAHFIRLNQSFRSDLRWWHTFLRDWNGISLLAAIGEAEPAFTVASDASGSWGCGAFFGPHWFQFHWPPAASSFSIAFLELVPIIIAGILWGKLWANCHVRALCDNQAVVDVIRSRYCCDDQLMHLLRCLFFVEARHNFTLVPEHIPGKHNLIADKLSRDHASPSFLQEMAMDPHPVVVPPEASSVLLDTSLDWLSHTWTDLFNSILNRV